MVRKFLRSMVVLPFLIVLGTVAAAADTTGVGQNMTMTVPSSATVIARVAIPVTVGISCTSPNLSGYQIYYGPFTGSNGSVTVSQASGTSVNNATGYINQQLVCDGTLHQYTVSITASAPFHAGQAAITGSASWNESFYGCTFNGFFYTCTYFSFTDSASVQGPLNLSV